NIFKKAVSKVKTAAIKVYKVVKPVARKVFKVAKVVRKVVKAAVRGPIYAIAKKQIKEIHYSRNKFNKNLPKNEALAANEKSKFRAVRPKDNAFHQNSSKKKTNVKYKKKDKIKLGILSIPTEKEVVYEASGKIEKDPRDIGTYNFGTNSASHLVLDVLPYLAFGNNKKDKTTRTQRMRLAVKGLLNR
ncbi:MAG: hypothetical protein ACRCUS_03335, partial [Anaerovoracaceae bacterium]